MDPGQTPIPGDVRALIPARFVETHQLVPLSLEDDVLAVAHPENVDPGVLRELGVLLNYRVRGVAWDRDTLREVIRANYGVGAEEIETLVEASGGANAVVGGAEPGHPSRDDLSEDAAIVTFVSNVLRQARAEGATDVHIEPFEKRLRVRFRVDGLLSETPVPMELHRFHAAVVSRIKVMAHLDIAERRLPQDGRFRMKMEGGDVDFRLSMLPTPHGEAVNIRILENSAILVGLESLGFAATELGAIDTILKKPHGVVLVTGPTGSGKTTTLYSFLNVLNRLDRKILTIEDPIEYDLHGVTQIQVRPKVGLGFAEGLRSMLRHDPDIMMVGEIRDEETAETVIRVALTGHLVFSTIHTNDATSTPVRLLDMGVEPYLVASSVECIIAQRLVRRICPDCAEPEDHGDAEALGLTDADFDLLTNGSPRFQRGRGCRSCRSTGYRGRTAIFEILPVSPEIREMILHRESADRVGEQARREGYWPLRWKGLAAAARGVTTLEEVLRTTSTPKR